MFYLQIRKIKQKSRTQITHVIVSVGNSLSEKGMHNLEGNSFLYFKGKFRAGVLRILILLELNSQLSLCVSSPATQTKAVPEGGSVLLDT